MHIWLRKFSRKWITKVDPLTDKKPLRSKDLLKINDLRSNGWGTWIRTKIDGVRVRSSTVELFPNARRAAVEGRRAAASGRLVAYFRGGSRPLCACRDIIRQRHALGRRGVPPAQNAPGLEGRAYSAPATIAWPPHQMGLGEKQSRQAGLKDLRRWDIIVRAPAG
jgi:hypothetical protein